MEPNTILESSVDQPATDTSVNSQPEPETTLVEDDLLVEEISIDGMCGVY